MAKTFRITIEYTTIADETWKQHLNTPENWDWPELLDIDPTTETFGLLSVSCLPNVNEDHVREIKEFAETP